MTRVTQRLALALGVTAFSLGSAVADDSTTKPSGADRPDIHASHDASHSSTHAKSITVRRLSKLSPADVYGSNGEKIGRITGVAVDANRGRIAYGVLSFGGLLGVGDKEFAIPWAALHKNVDKKDFDNINYAMNVDKDRLKNAQGFDKAHWPDMADMSWGREIHEFWGQKPYWEDRDETSVTIRAGREGVDVDVKDRDRDAGKLEGTPISPDDRDRAARTTGEMVIVKANDLVGHTVINNVDAKKFADLEEAMVDPKSGRLVYGIIQIDQTPDFEKDYMHAVPWQLLEVRWSNQAKNDAAARTDDADRSGNVAKGERAFNIVLNASVDKLKAGPKFPERDWPNMTMAWGEQVFNAYGVKPFWTGDAGSGTQERNRD